MGRIMAIDYGQKRAGIAVTDETQIIANALTTVHVKDIFTFLKQYIRDENVELIVVGEPKQMDNRSSKAAEFINPFVKKLRKMFPEMAIDRFDERFTSQMAFRAMIDAGIKKKARQDKALVDKISAAIILQSYLESRNRKR